MAPTDDSHRLVVRNERHTAVRFTIEPWAEEYLMPAGATFEILVEPAADRDFAWGKDDDGNITVFAPSGALARIFGPAGELSVGWGCSIRRPPALPEEVSMRQFIGAMFGTKR